MSKNQCVLILSSILMFLKHFNNVLILNLSRVIYLKLMHLVAPWNGGGEKARRLQHPLLGGVQGGREWAMVTARLGRAGCVRARARIGTSLLCCCCNCCWLKLLCFSSVRSSLPLVGKWKTMRQSGGYGCVAEFTTGCGAAAWPRTFILIDIGVM